MKNKVTFLSLMFGLIFLCFGDKYVGFIGSFLLGIFFGNFVASCWSALYKYLR